MKHDCAIVLLLMLLHPKPAHGFNAGKSFGASANTGGGGGLMFTGATRWRRYDCSICHVDAAGAVSVKLASDPPDLLSTGEWVPGQRYRITVKLAGEHLGMGNVSNINNFMADVTDSNQLPVGQFEFDSSTIATWADGSAIGGVAVDNRDEWIFDFTAPSAGVGRIELNVAAVDGNGAGSAASRSTDLLGDDVATLSVALCERGGGCEPEAIPDTRVDSTASGCSAAETPVTAWLGMLLVCGLFAVRRHPCWARK